MKRKLRLDPLPVVLALTVLASACMPDATRRARVDDAFLTLLAAEDARPVDGRALHLLIEAAEVDNVFLRRTAVRALGRLENPELLGSIVPALTDPAVSVRREAANAAAQSVQTAAGEEVFSVLLRRLDREYDPAVRGAIARSIGRLRLGPEHREMAEDALVDASYAAAEAGLSPHDAPLETMIGVALGLESLTRSARGAGVLPRTAVRLQTLSRYGSLRQDRVGPGRVRTLAMAALGQAGLMTAALVAQGLKDSRPQVGVTAVRYMSQVDETQRAELVRRGAVNPSTATILETINYLGTQPRTSATCRYLFAAAPPLPPQALRELPTSIRLAAIDHLAEPCPDLAGQRTILRDVASELPTEGEWQPASHALVSLARVFPQGASGILSQHTGHASPFVRAYAAQAARELGNRNVLRALANDPNANVRTAAIQGLFALDGHRVDEVLIGQLEYDDPQLLLTAAGLLEGTNRPGQAAAAALTALERISAAGRETWRDSRRALLTRIEEVGGPDLSDRVIPFLRDYDPLVADDAARILDSWNGRPYAAMPAPPERQPLPTAADMRAMDGASLVLHMAGGGSIVIALHPYLSPTNTFRFFRLASDGYFDGLTFHRWAPNFVIQGGSPGANEFQGDGPYSRDEVGLAGHWRGTVGISTRGHDTADGQIFVNLQDNVRLDHAYTIVGTVVEGMDVVDDVLEGGVIEQIEVRRTR
jgi:cyclophilin family peptidyl-prolyl cis-trans isomerase/HEAT repeat protein